MFRFISSLTAITISFIIAASSAAIVVAGDIAAISSDLTRLLVGLGLGLGMIQFPNVLLLTFTTNLHAR